MFVHWCLTKQGKTDMSKAVFRVDRNHDIRGGLNGEHMQL